MIRAALRLQRDLITQGLFQRTWDSLPLSKKLAWGLFVTNTLCILTMLEFAALA